MEIKELYSIEDKEYWIAQIKCKGYRYRTVDRIRVYFSAV